MSTLKEMRLAKSSNTNPLNKFDYPVNQQSCSASILLKSRSA